MSVNPKDRVSRVFEKSEVERRALSRNSSGSRPSDFIFFITKYISSKIVSRLSILFRILPFGVWFFGLVFALVARYGVRVLFSYEEVDAKAREIDSKLRNQFRHLLDAYEECKTTFHNRFLWTCPRQTLEVVMFVLACGLLFSCLDPATILAFSMIGLAVVERWNPFGFGSLTDMVTTLFDLVG